MITGGSRMSSSPKTIGILFIDTDGSTYDPHSDDRYAAWVLGKYGPDTATLVDEMLKAVADKAGWQRRRNSGYTCHAISQRNGHTAIVIHDPTGWAWQVYRTGGSRPLRDIRDTAAATAEDAVRLADEFIDNRTRRRS